MPMPVQFLLLSRRLSQLCSKHFATLFNTDHKSVIYIFPYFPHCLLSVGFFLAPGRAEINNTNLILEMSSKEQHPLVYSSHATSFPAAGSSSTWGTALAHPQSCTRRHEHPDAHSLLAIAISFVSNLEEVKVYNSIYIITFSRWYL